MRFLSFYRQQGVVLLVFFLALFTVATTVLLSALNTRNMARDQNRNELLNQAKQALIAFALAVPENYNRGPGHLPCPDTSNDGQPNNPCASGVPGRLPQYVTLTAPNRFPISPIDGGTDQQFWYAVSPAYKLNPVQVLNSSINGALTLDGATDIVAVIIDAGAALAGQTRQNNTAGNYLENSNASGTNFISTLPADPSALNDRIVAIRRHELMSVMTPRVAFEIKKVLDASFAANGSYPADGSAFDLAMSGSGWLATDQWNTITTYNFVSADEATVGFAGCNMVFTLKNSAPGITRSPNRC